MRIAVNQSGDRMDNPATVHDINVLTVVASESYKDFVAALQRDMSEAISDRPRVADEDYFTGKILKTETGNIEITSKIAKQIYKYLLKNDYIDENDKISAVYHNARKEERLATLPPELLANASQIFQLINSVFSEAQIPEFEDDRKGKTNPLNSNFNKKEFRELWNRINHKAAYTVHFETPELVNKCVAALNQELKVSPLQYTIQRGE